jgi:hypothetical protein
MSQIKTRPTVYRRLQQRLFSLLNDLKKQLDNPQQGCFTNTASQGSGHHPKDYYRTNYQAPYDPTPAVPIPDDD